MSNTRPPRVVVVVLVLSPVGGGGRRLVRNDVVVLLEGAPDCGREPAGSAEDVREVHVLQVRLGVAPGFVVYFAVYYGPQGTYVG